MDMSKRFKFQVSFQSITVRIVIWSISSLLALFSFLLKQLIKKDNDEQRIQFC